MNISSKALQEIKSYMSINKQIILLVAISLLAVSCSKAPSTAVPSTNTGSQDSTSTNPTTSSTTNSTPKDWKPFAVAGDSSFSVAVPPKWVEDKATTKNHFVLRSRINADGTKLGDSLMEFTTKPTAGKSLSEQVLADVAYGKSIGKPGLGRTESGLEYAFATFSDPTSQVKNWSGYALGLSKSAYVFILTASNGENSDIVQVVKSIK